MLDVGFFNIKANENQHIQKRESISNIDGIIKILLKAKKSKNLTKFKKLELVKTSNKIFGTDFLTPKAKTAFLYL